MNGVIHECYTPVGTTAVISARKQSGFRRLPDRRGDPFAGFCFTEGENTGRGSVNKTDSRWDRMDHISLATAAETERGTDIAVPAWISRPVPLLLRRYRSAVGMSFPIMAWIRAEEQHIQGQEENHDFHPTNLREFHEYNKYD